MSDRNYVLELAARMAECADLPPVVGTDQEKWGFMVARDYIAEAIRQQKFPQPEPNPYLMKFQRDVVEMRKKPWWTRLIRK